MRSELFSHSEQVLQTPAARPLLTFRSTASRHLHLLKKCVSFCAIIKLKEIEIPNIKGRMAHVDSYGGRIP